MSELQWEMGAPPFTDDPWNVILYHAMSHGSYFYWHIDQIYGEDERLLGYALYAEGTILTEAKTTAHLRYIAQEIDNIIARRSMDEYDD